MAKSGYTQNRDQATLDTVGANIRYYRVKNDLTQIELSNLCDIEQKMLSSYESGKVEIGVSIVSIIAKQLGLEGYQLMIPRPKDESAAE